MFGYVRPYRPELKLREDAEFRAYYCGVCHALGRRSPLCRALLRYDLAFLALVRDGAEGGGEMAQAACPLKLRKTPIVTGSALRYAADAHLLLTYAKCMDDAQDRGVRPLRLALGKSLEAAKAAQPALFGALTAMLKSRQALETAACASPDEAAEPFAAFCGELFAHDLQGPQAEALRWMGYNVGKWVDWLDALDDYAKDAASGDYNLWRAAGYTREQAVEASLPLLAQCAEMACSAWELIENPRNDGIVLNVLTQGMPRMSQDVAQGRKASDGSV